MGKRREREDRGRERDRDDRRGSDRDSSRRGGEDRDRSFVKRNGPQSEDVCFNCGKTGHW